LQGLFLLKCFNLDFESLKNFLVVASLIDHEPELVIIRSQLVLKVYLVDFHIADLQLAV
jgi:hypothetical protein